MPDKNNNIGSLHNLFLFTANYENNKPAGPIDVVPNTLLFFGNPKKADLNSQKRVLMRTNEFGMIYTLAEKNINQQNASNSPNETIFDFSMEFKGYKINDRLKGNCRDDQPQPILLPPPEAVDNTHFQSPKRWLGSNSRRGIDVDQGIK